MRVCDRCRNQGDGLTPWSAECGNASEGYPTPREYELCLDCCQHIDSVIEAAMGRKRVSGPSVWKRMVALFKQDPDRWWSITDMTESIGARREGVSANLYVAHSGEVDKRLKEGFKTICEWRLLASKVDDGS